MTMRPGLLLASCLLAGAACSPFSPDLGDSPFRCGTEDPVCPDGYSCEPRAGTPNGVCVVSSGSLVDGGPDGGGNGADAGPFVCNDDSALEPNDTTANATTTMIPDSSETFTLASLAICPDTDIDVYRFRIDVQGKNVVVEARETVRSRGDLVVEILNGSGVPVVTGDYTDNSTIRATLNNAATGTYFAQVRAAAAGTENNYNRIFIETSGP
jgi:hypothetical protein